MKLVVCSIYDAAVGAYMPPFFVRTKGEAMRMFLATAQDAQSSIAKAPKDFVLFTLGEYDDGSGQFSTSTPTPLWSALEALAVARREEQVSASSPAAGV